MERKRGFPAVVTVCTVVLALCRPAPAQYGGGRGTAEDPYLIYTAEQMNAIGAQPNDWDKHFKLMADIDLSAYTGTEFNLIGIPWSNPFRGVFDGNGHTISSFTYARQREYHVGLFSIVNDPNAEVRNLGLIAPTVDAGTGSYVGALVGSLEGGSIRNCYAKDACVSGNCWIGGLVGRNRGAITNCYATGAVGGLDYNVGGLAGSNHSGCVRDSHSTSEVSGGNHVGGLVGRNAGDLTDCYSTGAVISSGWQIGGLVGSNGAGRIADSFATGDVTGRNWIGGLVGEHEGGMIVDCRASGAVVANEFVGGLVGVNRDTICYCSASGAVSGTAHVGGLIGVNGDLVVHCYASGEVKGDRNVGGLVGYDPGNAISNCYSTALVKGRESVGGLVGDAGGTLLNNYSTSSVTGDTAVGGLVGRLDSGGIANSYSSGLVDGSSDHVGGLAGRSSGLVWRCYWDKHASRQATSAAGEGLTTAQMHDRQTFVDAKWDLLGEQRNGFCEIWQMPAGGGYPELASLNGYRPPDPNGDGSRENPFLVRHPADLSVAYHRPAGCFRLVSDIDLSGWVFSTAVIAAFGGRFDGAHHRITSMIVSGGASVGFFGYLGQSGVVESLRIENADITGKGCWVGALVAVNDGIASGCHGDGAVAGTCYVGLLVGENRRVVSGCCSTGSVTGYENVGGLVGHNWRDISTSFSTASVRGGDRSIGGLVGSNERDAAISNCYSAGLVGEGRYGVGGLVGGSFWQGEVTASFWDTQTSGWTTSAAGTGLTTAEMQTAATFLAAGWDFVGESENGTDDIWWITEGQDYPRLWWEQDER